MLPRSAGKSAPTATLRFDEVFHDREAEAVAFFAGGRARREAGVFAEELGALVGGDAGAGVVDLGAEAALGEVRKADGDAAAGRREFQGVAHEVGEHLVAVRGVAAGEREVGGDFRGQGDVFAGGGVLVLARDGVREEGEVDAAGGGRRGAARGDRETCR
jgi:hypothetical protein